MNFFSLIRSLDVGLGRLSLNTFLNNCCMISLSFDNLFRRDRFWELWCNLGSALEIRRGHLKPIGASFAANLIGFFIDKIADICWHFVLFIPFEELMIFLCPEPLFIFFSFCIFFVPFFPWWIQAHKICFDSFGLRILFYFSFWSAVFQVGSSDSTKIWEL